MRYQVTIGDRAFMVDVEPDRVALDDEPVEVDLRAPGEGASASAAATRTHGLLLGGASHRVISSRRAGGEWRLNVDGLAVRAVALDPRARAIRELSAARAADAGPRALRAPMPGLIVKVEVEEGDDVVEGQGLVIVEAMKMENELRADGPARVVRLRVEPGEAVEKDQVLIEFAAIDPDETVAGAS
jgi:pyruvate carboxylase subunit B